MKIVFLDFDGVINPLTFHHSESGFSQSACSHVQEMLAKDSEIRIVVSSAWRRHGLAVVKKILQENGIDQSRVIDVTDSEGGWTPENRDKQILRWLENHKEIKHFVAVDDYPLPKLVPNYVKTNGYVGFTQKDAEIALRILEK